MLFRSISKFGNSLNRDLPVGQYIPIVYVMTDESESPPNLMLLKDLIDMKGVGESISLNFSGWLPKNN